MQVDELKRQCSGRWAEILSSLGVDRSYLDGKPGPCPICREGKDRWRVFRDFDETGGAICNQCGKFGDGIAVAQRFLNCDFKTACHRIAEIIGEKFTGKAKSSSRTKEIKLDKRKHFAPAITRDKESQGRKWLESKPGIEYDQLARARHAIGSWMGINVICFPSVYPDSMEASSYIIYRIDGLLFPKTEHQPARKTHVLSDDNARHRDGMVTVGSIDEYREARTCWKCEGVTDALALAGVLPEGEIAVANICGAESFQSSWQPLRDQFDRIVIAQDNDPAGRSGSVEAAEILLEKFPRQARVDLVECNQRKRESGNPVKRPQPRIGKAKR